MSADTLLSRLDKVRPLPTIEYLRECFNLNPSTGALVWRNRPVAHFKKEIHARQWNTRFAGKSADVDGGSGYFLVCVNGIRFKAHRVVFALTTGADPGQSEIDHKNRIRSDNAPDNLRIATNSQNAVNLGGARGDNTHGGRGVIWNRGNKKWEAWAQRNGRREYLGLFSDKSDAERVATLRRRELFGEYFS